MRQPRLCDLAHTPRRLRIPDMADRQDLGPGPMVRPSVIGSTAARLDTGMRSRDDAIRPGLRYTVEALVVQRNQSVHKEIFDPFEAA